jgi:TonB family protein
MKISFIAIFLFSILTCAAQDSVLNISYLTDGRYVSTRERADYVRIVSVPDSGSNLYNIVDYYRNDSKRLIGKTSKIFPPQFEGQCVIFYRNGKKAMVLNYKNDLLVGEAYVFYPNGNLYLEKQYPDNGDKFNDINNNFLIKANYDSLGATLVKNGNGYYKGYEGNFKYIDVEGPVKNGKRDGVWKGTNKNLGVTYTENYKNGVFIEGTSIDQTGQAVNYTSVNAVPPRFKGGEAGFIRYIKKNIKYPDEARRLGIQGKVMVSFVVEKDGSVSDVQVARPVSPSIDAEAIRVVENSSRWVPGMQYGRPVRVMYSVPISFTLPSN